MYTFETKKNGYVQFYTDTLVGCCSITVLHNVEFYPRGRGNRVKLYKQFNTWLKKQKEAYIEDQYAGWAEYLDVHKLIMTDRSRRKGEPSIWDFCKEMKWKKGKPVKTVHEDEDHTINLFELNK